MIFFIVTAGGSLCFSCEVALYSIAFAISYSMAMIGSVQSIKYGPLAVSSLINQCSLILPTLYGIALLGDEIGVFGYIGIILVFACLWLVKPRTDKSPGGVSAKWLLWVAIGFIGNGMCSVIQKAEQLKFNGGYKNEFMILALFIGAIVMFLASLKNSKNIKKDAVDAIKYAPVQGIANGLLNMFVMILTALVPTSLLFPVVLSGGIIITFIASVTIFKEKITTRQLVGYILGIISIALMNI